MKNADVIVMAASVGSQNHRVYRDVFVALNERPHVPIICVNPDHYVRNHDGYLAVIVLCQSNDAQLGRSDLFGWASHILFFLIWLLPIKTFRQMRS